MTPMILVLLAACGSVSGRPPTTEDYDPRGAGLPAAKTLSPEESARLLAAGASQVGLVYPDDELRFTVLGQEDLSLDAKVSADGSIYYPMIGKVELAGRTVEEIRVDIKERLEKDYLVSAHVTVQIRATAPKRVYVLGAVGAPGEYELPAGKTATLLQAVAQARGFLEDADMYNVVIYRRSPGSSESVALCVDLVAVQGGGHDPVLQPNDIVSVPSREKVYVDGQVARPGAFVAPAGKQLTAIQAVALAGGYTRVANPSNVRLSRRMNDGRRKFFVLDLTQVTDGKVNHDVPLQPGDMLFVPESVF